MKIYIDNLEFEVDLNKTLLEILREKGYNIPFYCFHPNLRITASCRVCMVEIETNGKKYIVTACSTYPQEGVKVFPNSEKSKEARANILELMLIHHAIDCPLCEKGGKCDLQDFTYEFGRILKETDLNKILPEKQKFNGLLRFYQTRCILCYRCSNFFREELYSDKWLSFERGKKSFVGPFNLELTDEIPFLGYLTHLCPVGAILDNKDYSYGPRSWDLKEIESSCFLCSTGCELKFWVRKENREKVIKSGIKRKPNKIYKVIAKDNFQNPTIFCDRIFYGKDFISNTKRVFKGDNLEETKEKLKKALDEYAREEIALLISPREVDEVLKRIRNFIVKENIKNVAILPGKIYDGAQNITSEISLSNFENSFSLIYYTLIDYSHPVIGFELFRIMKEGKRFKKLKGSFLENVIKKENYFAVVSGFEDRFFRNSDFCLKLTYKKSYELLLDLLSLFYREKGQLPELKDFKYINKYFFEEFLRERKNVSKEAELICEKIKNYKNFIVVFNDMLNPKVQLLLYFLSKCHENGKVLNLRSAFNTEGLLRLFKGFHFKSLSEIKNKLKNETIKCLILYRVEPYFDIPDKEFLNLMENTKVFYINSLKPKYETKMEYLFISTPFEYGGEFINNLGEKRKINKLFDPIFESYSPQDLFYEENYELNVEDKILLDFSIFMEDVEEREFLIEKPNLWDINLLYTDNIDKSFDYSDLKSIVKLKRFFSE
ncbi:MAG: 2Fe-2S iron-sulfur cluster-binding protein [Candidatus Hydrothermales bacterium]